MSVRRALMKLWSAAKYIGRRPAQCGSQTYHSGNIIITLPRNQAAVSSRAIGGRVSEASLVQHGYDTARRIFANSLLSRVTTNLQGIHGHLVMVLGSPDDARRGESAWQANKKQENKSPCFSPPQSQQVSSELRKRTTRQLLYGNSTPFFAFVGLSLATGSIITKEDELEGLCMEIRSSVERLHMATAEAESDLFAPGETVGIHRFTFGPYIGKGANAAIYCAKKRDNDGSEPEIQSHMPHGIFPFAIKMLFNYGVQSNAFLIINKMANETLPARMVCTPAENEDDQLAIESIVKEATLSLPPHPNIVSMHSALADYVPEGLPQALSEIPMALPVRLHSEGFGRNMTLFLIMKRYDTNLKCYLSETKPDGTAGPRLPEVRESILLFAQLLEGVAHINRHGIAHRDLKSDNLLLDLSIENSDGRSEVPRLVLTDFGSSYCDSSGSLLLPFHTRHTDRGGNPALMAPEVVMATPGTFAVIDYSKSDVWAAGAIAYELFTGQNPFYPSQSGARPLLNSRNYNEQDLPPLPEQVPSIIQRLVQALLTRSPHKRPSADMAADILQLYLWAPSTWTKTANTLPCYSEILQWLLTLTTKVLTTDSFSGRRSQAEYQLISSFLRRIKLERVRSAIAFIRNE